MLVLCGSLAKSDVHLSRRYPKNGDTCVFARPRTYEVSNPPSQGSNMQGGRKSGGMKYCILDIHLFCWTQYILHALRLFLSTCRRRMVS